MPSPPNFGTAKHLTLGETMINPNAPQFILTAVLRIYDDLPILVGADWATIQPQVDAHIAALKAQPDAFLESTQLFGLLAGYEPARQRLSDELTIQAVVAANVTSPLAEMQFAADDTAMAVMMSGLVWDVDAATIPTTEDSEKETRAITMKDGGAAGAKSIKFKNLDLDLGKMLTIGAGFLLAGQDMLDKLTPFAVAGGILVMVGTLLGEMTVKIEQQEATVFWGVIQATGNVHGAGLYEATILAATNAERAKYGLETLNETQLRHSLTKLMQLKCVERDEASYRIIERFTIKN